MNYSTFKSITNKYEEMPDKDKLRGDITRLYNKTKSNKAVFGFDIYKYSKLGVVEQSLVPFIIDDLMLTTNANVLETESCFFNQEIINQIDKTKISTGDGYFIFFDNPFLAFIYVIYFNANLVKLNSSNSSLIDVIGGVTIRYTITYNEVYLYDEKYWGKAIIDCARIIALDKLNRFLVDKSTYDWFLRNTNGIETLGILKKEDFSTIPEITYENKKTILFNRREDILPCIKTLEVQKIDNLAIKQETHSVYSIYLQTIMCSQAELNNKIFVCSIGNTTSVGL